MLKRLLLCFCLAVAVAACQAPVVHETPSGKPERVFDAPPERVRSALLSELINRGYEITRESQSLIAGRKLANNFAVNLMLGSNYDPNVVVQSSFTIIPTGSQTRVVGAMALITNPGSAFERVTPFSNSQSSVEMQAALNRLSP